MYSVNPSTAAIMTIGSTSGACIPWSGQLVVDGSEAHVFAVGLTASNVPKVYSLDVTTRQSTEAVVDNADTFLAGVTDAGQLLALIWTGTEEGVFLLDPATGSATQIGALAGLALWSGQSAFDHAGHELYAIGQDASSATRFYSFSLDTLTQGPTSRVSSALVNPAARRRVAGWQPSWLPTGMGRSSGSPSFDSATAAVTKLGQLGDLRTWSSNLVRNPAGGSAYATGYDPAGAEEGFIR